MSTGKTQMGIHAEPKAMCSNAGHPTKSSTRILTALMGKMKILFRGLKNSGTQTHSVIVPEVFSQMKTGENLMIMLA